ncbi:glycosyltransferase family 4 protein [Aliterella atlantica]|uniref:Glycoside hydrolase n=1 Tax=Aliterella atlantica CENA595 TaxID=1618023 RepID=A0A0D8ZRU1_9CYAN|nr:glycoside hydrolase [Aliterella atlantica CENA595]
MKIAVIGAKGLPPKQGGIEHYCAEVYPRMVAQGHSVDLFARSSYTDFAWKQEYDYEGVRVISLPCVGWRGVDAFSSSAVGAISAIAANYDIIHFHALGPALFSCLPKIASSAKVVVTCQGLDWQRAKWGNLSSRLIKLGESTAARYADGIIVVSEELRSYFFRTYERQAVYIPNAPASYPNSDANFAFGTSLNLEQNRYLLFLGRLVPEKRPDLLIEAFQKLKPQGWKLVLAGGVSDTELYVSQLLEAISNDPNVVLAGELRGARLAEIVRGAGLFVLPSDVEGLPLSMLEAMREGIPVVASNIPPHQQLIDERRGVLFQSGDLDSCIEQLDWAISHLQQMQDKAQIAKQYVNLNYNWDKITDENINLYQALYGRSKKLLAQERKTF